MYCFRDCKSLIFSSLFSSDVEQWLMWCCHSASCASCIDFMWNTAVRIPANMSRNRNYWQVFNSAFNLLFYQPLKDTCHKCDKFKMQLDSSANPELQVQCELHLRKAEKVRAKLNSTKETASFHCRRVLYIWSSENFDNTFHFNWSGILQTPVGQVLLGHTYMCSLCTKFPGHSYGHPLFGFSSTFWLVFRQRMTVRTMQMTLE